MEGGLPHLQLSQVRQLIEDVLIGVFCHGPFVLFVARTLTHSQLLQLPQFRDLYNSRFGNAALL